MNSYVRSFPRGNSVANPGGRKLDLGLIVAVILSFGIAALAARGAVDLVFWAYGVISGFFA